MSVKMSLWTLLLFLLPFVSSENAGECQKPVLEGNVVFSSSALQKNSFPHETEVTLKCALGHVVDQGSDTIVCVNGQWSKQELTCKKRDCGKPISSPNMQYYISEGTLFGALIRPVCDRGYDLQGSSYRRCLATGWSGKAQCQLVTCGKCPEIPHSIIVRHPNKEILEFEDVVEFSCQDKYTLVGNGSVVCQENGEYSSLPQCKVMTCGKCPEIPHSIIVRHPNKEILECEDVVEFSCQDKYTLVGNGSVVCQENGEYSSLPQCKGKCQKPVLESNVVFSSSALLKNDFLHETEVTLKCALGHVVDQGSDTIVCVNGEWSKQELTCKIVTCGKCPEIPNSIIVRRTNKEILEFEDVVEFSCEDKYTLVGNGSVVCQDSGEYSSLPQCQERAGDAKDASAYSWKPVPMILSLLFVTAGFPIIYFLKQYFKNRNGSYDTGEERRAKEALMQENISYKLQGP